jgi:type II secretory pathway pseudopilin PulG
MNNQVLNTKYEIRHAAKRRARFGNTKYAFAFSLTEVLLAVGILAVGMLFIAGVFPVSVHFTTVAAERTIAATVADESFAKIKLYSVYLSAPSDSYQTPFDLPLALVGEYAYPSTPTADPYSKRYWWSAICRRIDPLDPCNVQVTVFISRKVGTGTQFRMRSSPPLFNLTTVDRPVAVFVSVTAGGRADELTINDNLPDGINETTFINDGATIVDDTAGNIYRVLERYPAIPNVIRLDKYWQGGALPGLVWVIPPPVGSGRYPCIAVYQKVMRF